MNTAKDRVLAGVPGHSEPPPPVVLMTVFLPGSPMPPAPEPGDRYGEDDHLGFYPAG